MAEGKDDNQLAGEHRKVIREIADYAKKAAEESAAEAKKRAR